jgi:hypothetical protein
MVNLPSRGEGWYSDVILLVEDDRPLMSCMCWRRLLEFSLLCSYRTCVRKYVETTIIHRLFSERGNGGGDEGEGERRRWMIGFCTKLSQSLHEGLIFSACRQTSYTIWLCCGSTVL